MTCNLHILSPCELSIHKQYLHIHIHMDQKWLNVSKKMEEKGKRNNLKFTQFRLLFVLLLFVGCGGGVTV